MDGSPPDPAGRAEDDPLAALHERVDKKAGSLARLHGTRLQCRRGCTDCCVDDLTVHPIEAHRIRSYHAQLLQTGTPHAVGRCAFLDAEGSCRIYAHRPYVCRTQGLPLLWFTETEDGEDIVEERDICPLNADGPPLRQLPPEDCWLIGPTELELQRLQDVQPGPQGRIALRDLFDTGPA